jgi:hypothetical protein
MSAAPWTCQRCTQINAEWAVHCGRCGDFRAPALIDASPPAPEPQPARAQTPRPRTLTVILGSDNCLDIYEGEQSALHLTWDECLGVFAVLTHPQLRLVEKPVPPYARMIHVDDFIASRQRYWSRSAPSPEIEPAQADPEVADDSIPF